MAAAPSSADNVINISAQGPVIIVKAPNAHILIESSPDAKKPIIIDTTSDRQSAPTIEDKSAGPMPPAQS